jgi:hypothetical protein
MGPIVLPDLSESWQATWADTKEIFTAANLVAVGGRLGTDDMEEDERQKPRGKDTVEPVFFHAMPQTFYDELLAAMPLKAVLDLTPGDGALALSAYKRNIVYTGMAFSDTHSTTLMKRLEKAIWRRMSDDTDPLYEPRLMAAVLGAAQDAKANAKKRKADKDHKGTEQNPRAAPKRRRGAPLDPHDPLGDEGDDDAAAADDDELSGDSARGDSFFF